MPLTLVLTRADVTRVLSMARAVEAVRDVFAAYARGEAQMPPKVYLDLPDHHGDFRAMPSRLGASAGVKWVNSHPDNPAKHGLPAVMGVYVLSDAATAVPLAVMDATLLTAARTGAAAAVASHALGPRAPRTLGLVGCGVQARTLLSAHRVLFPELEVLAYDVRRDAAEAFAAESGARVVSAAEACGADLVCASTPGRTIAVRDEWVRSGAHVNAIGADGPGKQECETALLRRAHIVVDDREQASHGGEVNVPLHRGELSPEAIRTSLGEVLAGLKPGRAREDELTLFDSTGLAVQDVALARVIHEEARRRGVGVEVDLVGA